MKREFVRGAMNFALLCLLLSFGLLSFGCAKPPASYSSSDGKMRPVNPVHYYKPEQIKAGGYAR